MNTLRDASFQDLEAILGCLDHLAQHGGVDDAARWRASVFAEMRRRFDAMDENMKAMEAARAARDAT